MYLHKDKNVTALTSKLHVCMIRVYGNLLWLIYRKLFSVSQGFKSSRLCARNKPISLWCTTTSATRRTSPKTRKDPATWSPALQRGCSECVCVCGINIHPDHICSMLNIGANGMHMETHGDSMTQTTFRNGQGHMWPLQICRKC